MDEKFTQILCNYTLGPSIRMGDKITDLRHNISSEGPFTQPEEQPVEVVRSKITRDQAFHSAPQFVLAAYQITTHDVPAPPSDPPRLKHAPHRPQS